MIDDLGEPQAGRFGGSQLLSGHRTDVAGETDFTGRHERGR